MGCDIHAVFERNDNGYWRAITSEYEENRHYFLFAWLAGVRNGFGFGGIPTHDPIKPIAEPRGLPDDFYLEDGQQYYPGEVIGATAPNGYSLCKWLGSHSHSWLTVDEILAAPLPASDVMRTGVVEVGFIKTWDGESEPDVYCGDTFGPGISVAASISTIKPGDSHARIEWPMPTDELDYFLNEIRRLKEMYGEVRMVFGFDS